jgi:hypothetical protein
VRCPSGTACKAMRSVPAIVTVIALQNRPARHRLLANTAVSLPCAARRAKRGHRRNSDAVSRILSPCVAGLDWARHVTRLRTFDSHDVWCALLGRCVRKARELQLACLGTLDPCRGSDNVPFMPVHWMIESRVSSSRFRFPVLHTFETVSCRLESPRFARRREQHRDRGRTEKHSSRSTPFA